MNSLHGSFYTRQDFETVLAAGNVDRDANTNRWRLLLINNKNVHVGGERERTKITLT